MFAIYLEITSLKGLSSMKLHRDIEVTQKTAWFMLHRIREVWNVDGDGLFAGPVEVDETYLGGLEGNKHAHKKQRLGRGGIGKSVVVGAKDRTTNEVRVEVVEGTDARTLQGFVVDHARAGPGVEVSFPQAAHCQLARGRFSPQPLSWPRAGQTKPSGQRLAARCRA